MCFLHCIASPLSHRFRVNLSQYKRGFAAAQSMHFHHQSLSFHLLHYQLITYIPHIAPHTYLSILHKSHFTTHPRLSPYYHNLLAPQLLTLSLTPLNYSPTTNSSLRSSLIVICRIRAISRKEWWCRSSVQWHLPVPAHKKRREIWGQRCLCIPLGRRETHT